MCLATSPSCLSDPLSAGSSPRPQRPPAGPPRQTLALIQRPLTPALIEHVHGRDLDVRVVDLSGSGWARAASHPVLSHLLDEHLLVAVGPPTGFPAGEPSCLARGYRRHVRHRLGPGRNALAARRTALMTSARRPESWSPDWIGKFACVAAGIGIAWSSSLAGPALPAGRDSAQAARRAGPVSSRRRHH